MPEVASGTARTRRAPFGSAVCWVAWSDSTVPSSPYAVARTVSPRARGEAGVGQHHGAVVVGVLHMERPQRGLRAEIGIVRTQVWSKRCQ